MGVREAPEPNEGFFKIHGSAPRQAFPFFRSAALRTSSGGWWRLFCAPGRASCHSEVEVRAAKHRTPFGASCSGRRAGGRWAHGPAGSTLHGRWGGWDPAAGRLPHAVGCGGAWAGMGGRVGAAAGSPAPESCWNLRSGLHRLVTALAGAADWGSRGFRLSLCRSEASEQGKPGVLTAKSSAERGAVSKRGAKKKPQDPGGAVAIGRR